ncbi:unnamed protein product [Caenorhabditis angaria]|uniref:G-protein coupled receptors family 1 profile domain-containing protein n=1 Tax=Caenorhabditis angaria TaxID=860376 RepID=A0A9P1I6N7_9PELO|nr:unnamed protein product [Caenorhabditis angaria]
MGGFFSAFTNTDYENEYLNQTHKMDPHPPLAISFAFFSLLGIIGNIVLIIYITTQKLYQNFYSSHFIAHLCITNLVGLLVLVPILMYNVYTGENLFMSSHLLCKIQTALTVTVWTVMAMMNLCIAGVHLLTFARIHYEQLFGLSPTKLCILSWIISFFLALPSITNGSVVVYGPTVRTCVFSHKDSGLKFLVYALIFGVSIPAIFSSYAYFRILQILFHSPIVFQSLGLYKSRFLVYAFLLCPLYTVPFYILTIFPPDSEVRKDDKSMWQIFCTYCAFFPCIIAPAIYGASLFIIKEEDMSLTTRTHKAPPGAYHHVAGQPQHSMQAQLI